MRSTASILHVDLDAFFAAVEQRDKPSLRGKPVIVGGVGPRGVVATASYEARTFGVRSAMSTAEARARCPHAAYLGGRFAAYAESSRVVMEVLREVTELVQPLSFDEAFLDILPRLDDPTDLAAIRDVAEDIRATVHERTALTCSVGAGSSKFMAKIASELNKPDGVFLVTPGSELDLLAPMPVTAIPGVGPATASRLHAVGVTTIQQLRNQNLGELTHVLGQAGGHSLHELARGIDHRPVVVDRETKSVSTEDTFAHDLTSHEQCDREIDRLARAVARRLRGKGLSGRTVSLKVRRHDFETITRSTTLSSPTDDSRVIARLAHALMSKIELGSGIRLLGVGVSALADWVQDDLFSDGQDVIEAPSDDEMVHSPTLATSWRPGTDVHHTDHGDGWVWGSGQGIVTVRFESRDTGPGPVRSFAIDDPALSERPPRPLEYGEGTVEP